jgi:TolB-like protein/DNA-binding winged helix-turn-helix (wHTH) protein/Tfp pilus assembly protein PilF
MPQIDVNDQGVLVTTRDADSAARPRATRLVFDRYVLDLDRGCLLLDGHEVPLRPKTFAVLSYLVENAGRLVSKDDIFGAVWANLAVTDDTLVQSIGELRRELGEDGSRLIKTIPRRGYRFDGVVTIPTVEGPSPITPQQAVPAHPAFNESVWARAWAWARTTSASRHRVTSAALVAVALLVGALLISHFAFNGSSSGIQRPKSAEVGTKPAIAILAFVNQSDDPSHEYFSDGLTQDVINALGQFSGLTVMSWNDVLRYKGKPADPVEVARGLAVRYQVEGGVLRTGDRIRVTARLVDREGHVLWSARFDEALVDVFALQDKITRQIAGVLATRVSQIEQQRVLAKPTESLEAYDYVLRARPALQHPDRAGIVEARRLLRRALELDPNYAAAYATLAETYDISAVMGWAESPSEALNRAEELANKALRIDESDVRARVILGRIHIFHQQYEQAKAEMDRAIAINPSDAAGLAGRGNILMWLGDTDAAIESLEAAQRIDSELSVIDRNALSLAYYLKGRYEAAIQEAELNLRRTESASFSRIVLAAAYAEVNRTGDVARVVAAVHRFDPTFEPQAFGTKFLKPSDLEHVRDGLRKAGLLSTGAGPDPAR